MSDLRALWITYWPAFGWFVFALLLGATALHAFLIGGLMWVIGRHMALALKVDQLERKLPADQDPQ